MNDEYKRGFEEGYRQAIEDRSHAAYKAFAKDCEDQGMVVRGDEIFNKTEYGLKLIGRWMSAF